MRKIRELVRLKFDLGLSDRKIAASLVVARCTVKECLKCAAAAGVGCPLPASRGIAGGHRRMLALDSYVIWECAPPGPELI